MFKEEITVNVLETIAEILGKAKEEIRLEDNLIDDLGADSLDIIEIQMHLEDKYDTTLDGEKIQDLRTINDIIDFIEQATF